MRADGNRHSLIQVWFMLLSSTSLYHNLHKCIDRSEQRMQENPSSKRYEKICSIDWISIWTSSALEPMFPSCWSWQHCMRVDMWQPDVAVYLQWVICLPTLQRQIRVNEYLSNSLDTWEQPQNLLKQTTCIKYLVVNFCYFPSIVATYCPVFAVF
jgi:hypothetical protein